MPKEFETLNEHLKWIPPERDDDIISGGILVPNTSWVIFGDPKVWKTNAAIHLAFKLAQGKDWFGYKTRKVLPFYVQIEIPKARFQRRIKKYRLNEDVLPGTNMLFRTVDDLPLDTTYGEDNLSKILSNVRQHYSNEEIVLILDNLLNMMVGDVSKQQDLGRVLKAINTIKHKHNITVILLHHSRQPVYTVTGDLIDAKGHESLGSSWLGGWCDTEMRMRLLDPHGLKSRVRCEFTFSRHAEDYLPSFEIAWSRQTLHPRVTNIDPIPFEEPEARQISIRGLE
jgi:hypothetical protein